MGSGNCGAMLVEAAKEPPTLSAEGPLSKAYKLNITKFLEDQQQVQLLLDYNDHNDPELPASMQPWPNALKMALYNVIKKDKIRFKDLQIFIMELGKVVFKADVELCQDTFNVLL